MHNIWVFKIKRHPRIAAQQGPTEIQRECFDICLMTRWLTLEFCLFARLRAVDLWEPLLASMEDLLGIPRNTEAGQKPQLQTVNSVNQSATLAKHLVYFLHSQPLEFPHGPVFRSKCNNNNSTCTETVLRVLNTFPPRPCPKNTPRQYKLLYICRERMNWKHGLYASILPLGFQEFDF